MKIIFRAMPQFAEVSMSLSSEIWFTKVERGHRPRHLRQSFEFFLTQEVRMHQLFDSCGDCGDLFFPGRAGRGQRG